MADKKKEAPPKPDSFKFLIGLIAVLMIVGTYIDRVTLATDESGKITGPDAVIPAGDVRIGQSVVNRGVTTLRQYAGGPIIGEQQKRSVGVVAEGPRPAFGKDWIRVDYKNDPDGWVLLESVTAHVGWFHALNIVPILLEILRPIGIIFTIILAVLFFLVLNKQREVAAFEKKKKQTEEEFVASQKPPEPIITVAQGPIDLPGVPGNLPTGLPAGLAFERPAQVDTSGPKNERWDRVQRLMQSTTASDWRQAVIEADIILEEMLDRMGYKGTSIGDKLKQIEQSDFVTLNKAWEAHKIRNHLAHRGGDYIFPKNEAERVIGMYEQVFREFYYI